MTYTDVPTNGITYNNSFYERLQQIFDKHDHQFKQTTNVSVTIGPSSNTKLNASGNLKMNVNIPLTKNTSPNYSETIINGKLATSGFMKILLDTISNADFIANPTTDKLTSDPAISANGITYEPNTHAVGMKSLLDQAVAPDGNPLLAWNLNYDRKMNISEAKRITAHILSKLNEVIDYVITNDIKSPDNDFRKRVLTIFANESGLPYPFAINTLMLPALVNYLASNGSGHNQTQTSGINLDGPNLRELSSLDGPIGNPSNEHAMRYVGIVKKGSKLFPKDGTTKFGNDRWIPSGEGLTLGTPCTFAIMNNNQKQFNIGAYNYPFADGASVNPKNLAVLTNSSEDPVIKNIQVPQPNDKYDDKTKYNTIVFAKTPLNNDATGRFDPQPIKYSRVLNWDNEFKKGTMYLDHAVKVAEDNTNCTKTWNSITSSQVCT